MNRLVAFVQQLGTEAIFGVANVLSTSAMVSGPAAAALLAALLMADRSAAVSTDDSATPEMRDRESGAR